MLRRVAFFIICLTACCALTLPAVAGDLVLRTSCSLSPVYTEVGTWVDSNAYAAVTGGPACRETSRSSKEAGAYAEFAPQVDAPGEYAVYVAWGVTSSQNEGPNAENVTFSIIDSEGSQDVVLDQRGKTTCSGFNANTWIAVGTGIFTPDGQGKLRITNTADGQCYNGSSKRYANIDAIRLVSLEPLPVAPTSWGTLKSQYR